MICSFACAVFTIVLWAVGVAAQNSTSCTTSVTATCLEAAVQAGGCSGLTDLACICNSASATQGATACFQTNCPDDVQTGLAYLQTLCSQFTSVTTAVTTATATVTASASSTTSSTGTAIAAQVSPLHNGASNIHPIGYAVILAISLSLGTHILGL